MALVNHTTREINAKIVYYGPGLSGKTTNIHFIYHRISPTQRGKLISLATETDRTLFFDFLPVELGTIKNYRVRFHLYTVPGQVFYNATRKLVLKGADGVIFVADSQRAMLDSNHESLANLKDNLGEQGIDLETFPMVIQHNKRDLPDVLSPEELDAALNPRNVPSFGAVAMSGEGVLKTFTSVAKLVLQDMQKHPDRHNLTLGDIGGQGEKPQAAVRQEAAPAAAAEADLGLTDAKSEMAALEQAVDQGVQVDLRQAFMEEEQIVLPFGIRNGKQDEEFQLRVTIDMAAPLARRFKIVVKNIKK